MEPIHAFVLNTFGVCLAIVSYCCLALWSGWEISRLDQKLWFLKLNNTEDLDFTYLCSPVSKMGALALAECSEGLERPISLLSSSFRLYWTKLHLCSSNPIASIPDPGITSKSRKFLKTEFPHEFNFRDFFRHLGFEKQSWNFFLLQKFLFPRTTTE